jgi:hypothetical protein
VNLAFLVLIYGVIGFWVLCEVIDRYPAIFRRGTSLAIGQSIFAKAHQTLTQLLESTSVAPTGKHMSQLLISQRWVKKRGRFLLLMKFQLGENWKVTKLIYLKLLRRIYPLLLVLLGITSRSLPPGEKVKGGGFWNYALPTRPLIDPNARRQLGRFLLPLKKREEA